MKKIVLTGGGTAGHVTPNMALIPHLLEDGWTIHYIGTKDGIERQLIEPLDNVQYHTISSGKLRRYFSLKNFTDPFRVVAGIFQSRRILKMVQPKVVFSKGGFVSVPVAFGAKSRKIPVVLHESDYSTGLANKITMSRASVVCVSFEPTLASIKGGKGVWTGSPIRDSLMQGRLEAAQAFCQFEQPDKPWVLFMGGSLGAEAINLAVSECVDTLCEAYNVVHIRGKGKLDESIQHPGYRQYEYVNEQMADLFSAASLVTCRSGANTLFELLALGKPSLLIPLPLSSSRGDQILNAKYFRSKGYAHILFQEELTAESLLEGIRTALDAAGEMKEAMAESPAKNGTQNVLEQIYKAGGVTR